MTTLHLSVKVPLYPSEVDLPQTSPMDSQVQANTMLMLMPSKIRLRTPSESAITNETSFPCLMQIKTILAPVLTTLRVDLPALRSPSEVVTQVYLKITSQAQALTNPTSMLLVTITPTLTLAAAQTALALAPPTKTPNQAQGNMTTVTTT